MKFAAVQWSGSREEGIRNGGSRFVSCRVISVQLFGCPGETGGETACSVLRHSVWVRIKRLDYDFGAMRCFLHFSLYPRLLS